MTFYDSFARLCADHGVAPSKAAQDIGCSRATVTAWKNGGGVSNAIAKKIAAYFGVSVSVLLGNEEIEKAAAPKSDSLSDAEWRIIMSYRKATEADRLMMDLIADRYCPTGASTKVG